MTGERVLCILHYITVFFSGRILSELGIWWSNWCIRRKSIFAANTTQYTWKKQQFSTHSLSKRNCESYWTFQYRSAYIRKNLFTRFPHCLGLHFFIKAFLTKAGYHVYDPLSWNQFISIASLPAFTTHKIFLLQSPYCTCSLSLSFHSYSFYSYYLSFYLLHPFPLSFIYWCP